MHNIYKLNDRLSSTINDKNMVDNNLKNELEIHNIVNFVIMYCVADLDSRREYSYFLLVIVLKLKEIKYGKKMGRVI